MTSILPPHLTADAIPERRAPEEPHAPTPGQAQEFLRRLENEEGKNLATDEESQAKNPTTPPPEPSRKPAKPDETNKEKKTSSKSKKKPSSSPTTINNTYNICGTNIQCGTNNTYNVVMGFPKGGSPFTSPSFQRGSQPKTQQNDQPPVSEKIFKSLDVVTEEDCTIMSEYIKSEWKDLGKILFSQLSLLDDYLVEVENKSKREAVRWILTKWREIAGKSAKVGRLAIALKQLDEYKALEKLSKRHLK